MFEHRVELKSSDLEARLRTTRYRLPFVDAHSGAPIGYFVPEGCNSDVDDPQGPLAVTFEMRTAYGGLDDITEFWTQDVTQSLGFFVPETEVTLKKYEPFRQMYSQEYFAHILATQPTGRPLAEIMKDLRGMT